ncbi:MAG: CoA transferase [Dehalococcoidia bacterium]|nr:MAG: CoA transferase [Dehalococcoidia bacterium]
MRVLEISDTDQAAAWAGKWFARWGAEVIRVTSPSRAPITRAAEIALHGGKTRVRIDRTLSAGRKAVARLARGADVIISDLYPRDLDAIGFDTLGGVRTRARVAVTPFGRTGPYRDYEATAATLLAAGGYTHLSGDPGRAPLTMPGPYPYAQAGTLAYSVALASALGSSGCAAVDLSMLEMIATLHQFTDVMWQVDGVVRSRHGNRWENLCPTTMLRARDGWVAVNILQQFWPPFALWVGGVELEGDASLAQNADRMERRDEVEALCAAFFQKHTARDLFRDGQEKWRVPIGYVQTFAEMREDPQLVSRRFWRGIEVEPDIDAPDTAGIVVPGSAFQFAGERRVPERPPRPVIDGATGVKWRSAEAPLPRGVASSRRPLEGIRVLDFTRIWSGPLAARFLGDLGAEVIRVEAPDGRGPAIVPRGTPGYYPDGDPGEKPYNRQGLNNKLMRNKRSLAIDLKSSEGRQAVLRLVAVSDVVVENFSARAMPSLGLDYEALSARNPRLIFLTMPSFGSRGPYRDYVGLGPSIEPLSGLTALMGYSQDEPRMTVQALTDAASGVCGLSAVMTALWQRGRTGKGAFLDLSQSEAMAAFLAEEFVAAQISKREPERLGNGAWNAAPYGVYRCLGEDEWISIGCVTEAQWVALARLAGRGWEADGRYATLEARLARRDALDEAVEAWTSAEEKRALTRRLQAVGVAAAPVQSAPEWLSDPHLEARGYFTSLETPDAGRYQTDGLPMLIDGERGYAAWTGAPGLGEHNAETLRLVGYTDAEITDLAARGIIVDRPPQ